MQVDPADGTTWVAVVGLIKPNDEVRVRHEEDILLCDDAILSLLPEIDPPKMIEDRSWNPVSSWALK